MKLYDVTYVVRVVSGSIEAESMEDVVDKILDNVNLYNGELDDYDICVYDPDTDTEVIFP